MVISEGNMKKHYIVKNNTLIDIRKMNRVKQRQLNKINKINKMNREAHKM